MLGATINLLTQVAERLDLLLRHEDRERLAGVPDDSAETSLAEFAASVRRDRPVVQAVLDLPWTMSPAEGQINRPKTIGRAMHSRAGCQLLGARVLYARQTRNDSTGRAGEPPPPS